MFNTHIHTFRNVDVPSKFLPLRLVRFLSTKFGFNFIAKLLNKLNPFSDDDMFDRYVKFMTIGNMSTQKEILEQCKKFYQSNTSFVVLPMDMAYMKAGSPGRSYREQLDELADLKDEFLAQGHLTIRPFVHIDPRRPDYLEIFKYYIEEKHFSGLKLYPSLGYLVTDERLYPIYEYCESFGIPIIVHCSPYNTVHYRGSKKEIREILNKSTIPFSPTGSKKELCSVFSHPGHWKKILKDFPKLKVCLAHAGGEFYWKKYIEAGKTENNWMIEILKLINSNDNIYTDIAFTMGDEKFYPLFRMLLKKESLKRKFLFGSDFYMVETQTYENTFSVNLKEYLGIALFSDIALKNPMRFLKKISRKRSF